MSRRILQVVTVVLGLVPIVTGLVALAGVDDPLYAALDLPRSPVLDSNLRFFAGVWMVRYLDGHSKRGCVEKS